MNAASSLVGLAGVHLPMLLVFSLALFFGTVGGRIFQRLRIPQVVGYIAIGILVGRSCLNLIDEQMIARFQPVGFFALGVIGFMIGGELKLDVFRKYGRQLIITLLAEGLGAFVVVSLLTTGLSLLFMEWHHAVALGVVLGAIASATAPAATVDVLWEYKTRGPLTTTVFALVALDDGLALLLYALASAFATKLTGQVDVGAASAILHTAYHIGGALVVGAVAGVGLNWLLRWTREYEKALTFSLGMLGMVIGVTRLLEMDMILAAMALGATVVNLAPRRSREAFDIMERFAPPIYVLFFVMVGARMTLGAMTGSLWLIALAYVAGRTGGKILGATLGARWAGMSGKVQKYLGMCLFSQAGVAIGLAMLATDNLGEPLGAVVTTVVTATTFLVQLVGPPAVKYAVAKAGEVGLEVTEEDLINDYKVGDVVDRQTPAFDQGTPLAQVLPVIAHTDATAYLVVDDERRLAGMLTLEGLKHSLASEGMWQWLLAFDVMEPVPDRATDEMPLREAITRMGEQNLDYLPVVQGEGDALVGMLEDRKLKRFLTREVIRRKELADEQAEPQTAGS